LSFFLSAIRESCPSIDDPCVEGGRIPSTPVPRDGMIGGVILGLATELVRLDDVRRSLAERGEEWVRSAYTEGERATCMSRSDPAPGLAARLAAKTAALATLSGSGGALTDVEVLSEASGRPTLALRGPVREAADRLGVRSIHVSLTHAEGSALAVVVLEGAA
jgi:holo-[acyl-carrier protein] synthase